MTTASAAGSGTDTTDAPPRSRKPVVPFVVVVKLRSVREPFAVLISYHLPLL